MNGLVYVTGDTHREFNRIALFCKRMNTSVDDIMIILGDAGINYFENQGDVQLKEILSRLPITLLCVHGNHEARPSLERGYKLIDWHGGKAYAEEKYPNLVFAKDGEVYQFQTADGIKTCMAIGGAYSVDKEYRLLRGLHWFPDEQPSEAIKGFVEEQLEKHNWNIDYILSHTCPLKYEPVEWFLRGLNQSKIDKSTERWLDEIENKLAYKKWYCGHYHGNKKIDRMQFMFESVDILGC